MKLWKTTIVIWSKFDPQTCELIELAKEATDGNAKCTKQESRCVQNVDNDPDSVGIGEFFDEVRN